MSTASGHDGPAAAQRPAGPRQFKRRAEIIDAAARVFAELGYAAASTQAIAQVLNLRQASLYYYFSSKEEALAEVCEIGVQGFVETLEEIVDSDRAWSDKLRAGILHHLLPLRGKRAYVLVFQRERHRVPAPHRLRVRALTHRYDGLWHDLLAGGQAQGAFRPDLDIRLTVYAIIGMCNAASAWLDPLAPGEIERTAALFGDLVLDGLVRR